MEFLKEAFSALPSAAKNPLALVAYLAVTVAWVLAVFRSRRLKVLLKGLEVIPKNQRAALVSQEMGTVLPRNISVEQWIRAQKHKYYIWVVALLIGMVIIIAAIAAWKAWTERPQLHVTFPDVLDNLKPRDANFEKDPLAARVFWLLREPGASIALGTCPGPECFQFTLGQLRTEEGSLVQQIFLNGPGFGVRRYPGPGLRLHVDSSINIKGSNLAIDPNSEKMWTNLTLARGNYFEMLTKLADISLKVLDTRSDSLRIHLEVRRSSYVPLRLQSNQPAAK